MFEHGYDYTFQFMGKTIQMSVSIPVRNFETFLRDKDTLTRCECGASLMTQNVTFGLNGSGRTVHRPVQYCPRCEHKPLDYAHLCAAMDGKLILI